MRILRQAPPLGEASPLTPFRTTVAALAVAGILLGAAVPLRADTIPLGVVGTGLNVNSSGIDQSYTLTSSADPGNPGPNVFLVTQFPPNWLGNTATSKWVGPRADASWDAQQPTGNQNVGIYIYETHFTVPSNAILSTAQLTGQLAVDNQLTDVILNGNHLHITTPLKGSNPEDLGYSTQFYPFSITSGFQVGTNVLDFFVANLFDTNGPNPTGLQVQLSGTVNTLAPIPEPGTLVLASMGFFGLLAFEGRRRKLCRG
jgi:PEP-CTERM motif-containing protein